MAVGILCAVGSYDLRCNIYDILFQKEEVVLAD
jgi:hypothetical protein